MKKPKKNKCPGGVVGIIFYIHHPGGDGLILLLERKTHPLGWAPPAGHLDGKSPDTVADKEALEEVSLKITEKELILGPIELMNECSRPKDSAQKYNCHDWWIYRALDWDGWAPEPQKGELDKIGEVRYFKKSEIMDVEGNILLKLDPVWEELFPLIWEKI
ncbi:NUDIX hydrolase [Patescibacteria group bacterium]